MPEVAFLPVGNVLEHFCRVIMAIEIYPHHRAQISSIRIGSPCASI